MINIYIYICTNKYNIYIYIIRNTNTNLHSNTSSNKKNMNNSLDSIDNVDDICPNITTILDTIPSHTTRF